MRYAFLVSFLLSLVPACHNDATCNTAHACPTECLVNNRCVTHCGGPETECGCCECGTGSINVRSCATADAP